MTNSEWRFRFFTTLAVGIALIGVWRLNACLDRVEDERVRPVPVEVVVTYPPAAAVSPPAARPSPSRASRTRRVLTAAQRPAGAAGWAATADAVRVANCESADLPRWPYSDGSLYLGGAKGVHLRDPNGHDGKWQASPDFWRTYGGLAYAHNAADATEQQQDEVAYRGWLARGWQPWTCARKLGIL